MTKTPDTDKELKELARRLRIARAACSMSQGDASTAAQVGQSSLSLYEKGEVEPHYLALKRLAVTYGASLDWLAGMTGGLDPNGSG